MLNGSVMTSFVLTGSVTPPAPTGSVMTSSVMISSVTSSASTNFIPSSVLTGCAMTDKALSTDKPVGFTFWVSNQVGFLIIRADCFISTCCLGAPFFLLGFRTRLSRGGTLSTSRFGSSHGSTSSSSSIFLVYAWCFPWFRVLLVSLWRWLFGHWFFLLFNTLCF